MEEESWDWLQKWTKWKTEFMKSGRGYKQGSKKARKQANWSNFLWKVKNCVIFYNLHSLLCTDSVFMMYPEDCYWVLILKKSSVKRKVIIPLFGWIHRFLFSYEELTSSNKTLFHIYLMKSIHDYMEWHCLPQQYNAPPKI